MHSSNDESLPGFVFHPTDEELVRFYLHKKIKQQIPSAFNLIPELDIYKYDPWDLPKVSPKGEFQRDWYFFCQRDRKYRNSPRPNRVCFSGYWKATGTDRPVCSHPGQCIGLKKSLVFYQGKAAKGIKTDWMMHEFRLPDTNIHNNNDPNWTICRILKKKGRSGNMVDSSIAEDIRDDANSSTPLVDSPQIESVPSSPPTNSPHVTSYSSSTITNSPVPKNNPHNYQFGTDILESLLEPSSVPSNTKPSLTLKLNQRQNPLVMNQIDGFWSPILLSSPVVPMGRPSPTYEWPQWTSFAEPSVNERHPSDIYTPSPQVGSVVSIWDYPCGLL